MKPIADTLWNYDIRNGVANEIKDYVDSKIKAYINRKINTIEVINFRLVIILCLGEYYKSEGSI